MDELIARVEAAMALLIDTAHDVDPETKSEADLAVKELIELARSLKDDR